jgi:hypothetical protein
MSETECFQNVVSCWQIGQMPLPGFGGKILNCIMKEGNIPNIDNQN